MWQLINVPFDVFLMLHHLFNREGGANHHDNESKHHDSPGGKSPPGVPATLSLGETEVGGRGEDECHGGRHQTTLGEWKINIMDPSLKSCKAQ